MAVTPARARARSAAFRAAPSSVPASRPSRRQATVLLATLVLVVGTVVAVSYLVRPDHARTFDLVHGSLFLSDSQAPVAVDLASGRPTVRLLNANAQVGAANADLLSVTPLSSGTLLLNRDTGEFNMVASTGFVVKTNGGVPIAQRPGATGAVAIASGDLAYIEQTGPTGTSVYLVGQTTVETASNVDAKVRPRALRSMTEAGSAVPGAAAGANGSLWLLLGSGTSRVVRQLSVPAGSSAGATLTSADHKQVSGPAAIASASKSSDGSGPSVVGVASADRIDLYGRDGTIGTARFSRVAGLDKVLAATNGQGRLSYLLHGSAGWSVVSVGTDGRGLRGPVRLTGVAANAALTAPATSDGTLFTMDSAGGQLISITGDHSAGAITGADRYPLATLNGRVVEAGGFGDAYVIARGSRVVYNSPSHQDALVLFTDGSHAPVTIEKSSAVSVSAAGGVEALTRSRADATTNPSNSNPKQQTKQTTQVNNKIDCKQAKQKPHIPTIIGASPGSRSVVLTWTYPLLSPQDCIPSTYVVGVTLLSDHAPAPPATVRVQGQQSVNLAGLFPSSQYEITVTAFINGEGTVSPARRITTGPEGPAAPEDVNATTDSGGNWNITWSSCGSVGKGCVATSAWQVIPEICDGRGLSGTPAPITVTADPTSVSQPPAQLQGGDSLLGRGLRFQVEGIGTQGTVGDPSGYTACTYSWAPPIAADLSLRASTRPLGQLGSTTSATVTLDAGSDAVRATGGVGATFTYTLLSGGSTVRTIGPTSRTSVTFSGIAAGQSYQARASVAPPRHMEAAVTVGPVDVAAAIAPWPTISATVGTPSNQGATSANVTVSIAGLTSASAQGERFDLVNSGFQCGSAGFALTNRSIDPADPITFAVDRQSFNGPCTVRIRLAQNVNTTTNPSLFGNGTTSNAATSNTFTVDPPSLVGVSGSDFSAAWAGPSGGQSLIAVTYGGGNPLISLASNWTVSVTDPDGTACGGYSGHSQLDNVAVTQSCVDADGASGTDWQVTVSYTFFGAAQGPFTDTGVTGGSAPTYTPPQGCDPANAGIGATWSGSAANPTVSVTVADATKTQDCSGWAYTVVGPTSSDCGGSANQGSAPPQDIIVTCSDTPAVATWSVDISYTDTDGNANTLPSVIVAGIPPP